MEMHGAALERMLAVIGRNGAAGATIVDQLTRDELVASVLLLYDLHPVDLETRVRGALDKTRPYLKSHGGNVELVGIDEARVRAAPDAGQLPRLPLVGRHAQARHRAGDLRGRARRERDPRGGPGRARPARRPARVTLGLERPRRARTSAAWQRRARAAGSRVGRHAPGGRSKGSTCCSASWTKPLRLRRSCPACEADLGTGRSRAAARLSRLRPGLRRRPGRPRDGSLRPAPRSPSPPHPQRTHPGGAAIAGVAAVPA